MIELISLVKRFDDFNAVDNISMHIKNGEFLTLLGPSGCGKTTTLRMIAGFEDPTEGTILLDGHDVSHKHPYERDVNTVFQNYALFPHMNVFDNIAFGLKIKKIPKKEIREKVIEALKLVRLEGYESRMPSQLSGGQKQRVAIARAVINNPKVLLLDEPLGALDMKLRKEMQVELKHLQQKIGITFIYVTHDQEEALIMSDRIAVMNKGRIEQIGLPNEIYERPKTKFVVDFIGETNMFNGNIKSINEDEAALKLDDGNEIRLKDNSLKTEAVKPGQRILVSVRPEKLKLGYEADENRNCLKGSIKERIYVGAQNKTVVILKSGKEVITSEQSDSSLDFSLKGTEVYVSWNYEHGVMILQ